MPIEKLQKLMLDDDGHGFYQADDAEPEDAVCEYSKAQAREKVLVDALRGVIDTGHYDHYFVWRTARATLAQIDAEKENHAE